MPYCTSLDDFIDALQHCNQDDMPHAMPELKGRLQTSHGELSRVWFAPHYQPNWSVKFQEGYYDNEINRLELDVDTRIGEGHFGIVSKGTKWLN